MAVDKYDKAIKYLVKRPSAIFDTWVNALPTTHGRLFQFCSPSGKQDDRFDGKSTGCLTQIRGGMRLYAWTDKLTKQIRADKRIPKDIDDFAARFPAMNHEDRQKALEPFAEWQRRLDKEIRSPARVKP